ncbi:MAG: TolC family protein [Treponema sp.]|nr:TolC family protein [Treponema sp.]
MNAVFILLGMALCGSLCAQEAAAPVRLTPDEAVDMALKNNLSLESARASSGTKKRASDLSWNQFIPSVTLGASLVHENSRIFLQDESDISPVIFEALKQQMPLESTRWGIATPIQASLSLSVAMIENMNRLRLDYEGGMIAYDKAKIQIERDVRKAYNSMLLLQENINLLKESFEAAGRRVAMARANYNAGLAPELTLLQAQVAMENMKPTIDQVENGFRISMAQFAMFLGLPYDTPFELIPAENEHAFIPLDVRELISKAASGKPDIRELRHNILLLQSARKTQSRALLPSLTLSWNTTPYFFLDPKPETTINLANPTASTINPERNLTNQFTISLGLRLHSLIPFSPDFQGIKNMDDQIRTATIGLAQLIRGTEIEIYNTILSLEKTQATTEAQTQTVDLAERAYRLTEQAYRSGLQDLLQVQNAELELKQAKVSMLEQQFNYLNGLLDLEYAIGVPFGTLVSNGNLSKESE